MPKGSKQGYLKKKFQTPLNLFSEGLKLGWILNKPSRQSFSSEKFENI